MAYPTCLLECRCIDTQKKTSYTVEASKQSVYRTRASAACLYHARHHRRRRHRHRSVTVTNTLQEQWDARQKY